MKKFLLFSIILFSPFSFAADNSGSVFSTIVHSISNFSDSFNWFFSDYIPSFFSVIYAKLIYLCIYIKLQLLLGTLKFSMEVARVMLGDLGVFNLIESQIKLLPQNYQALISQLGVIQCLNIILQAYIARFVMRFSFF